VVRAGQLSVTFSSIGNSVYTTAAGLKATIGSSVVSAWVFILKNTSLSLVAPESPSVTEGESIDFLIRASDPEDRSVLLSSSDLPPGATFDSSSGRFEWTTSGIAPGSYPVQFQGTNTAGETATAEMTLEVMPREPRLKELLHAATRDTKSACSPGSLATIEGSSLHRDGEVTLVSINAQFVTLIESSQKRLVFQCPDLPAGTPLLVQVQRGEHLSNVLESVMADASPGVFSLDNTGKGQGLVFLEESTRIVMHRNARVASQPAIQADRISILVTGIGAQPSAESMVAVIGQQTVPVEAIQPVAPGLWHVSVRVPRQEPSDDIPLHLRIRSAEGRWLPGNAVTIAIESLR